MIQPLRLWILNDWNEERRFIKQWALSSKWTTEISNQGCQMYLRVETSHNVLLSCPQVIAALPRARELWGLYYCQHSLTNLNHWSLEIKCKFKWCVLLSTFLFLLSWIRYVFDLSTPTPTRRFWPSWCVTCWMRAMLAIEMGTGVRHPSSTVRGSVSPVMPRPRPLSSPTSCWRASMSTGLLLTTRRWGGAETMTCIS